MYGRTNYVSTIDTGDRMVPCKKCGKEIAVSYFDPAGPKKCPHCGAEKWWEEVEEEDEAHERQ